MYNIVNTMIVYKRNFTAVYRSIIAIVNCIAVGRSRESHLSTSFSGYARFLHASRFFLAYRVKAGDDAKTITHKMNNIHHNDKYECESTKITISNMKYTYALLTCILLCVFLSVFFFSQHNS